MSAVSRKIPPPPARPAAPFSAPLAPPLITVIWTFYTPGLLLIIRYINQRNDIGNYRIFSKMACRYAFFVFFFSFNFCVKCVHVTRLASAPIVKGGTLNGRQQLPFVRTVIEFSHHFK